MKIFKEYIFTIFILIIILSLLFNKLIDGSYIFTSGDTLSPIAIKNSILNYNSFPYWFPWIFGGMPTVHSLMNVSNYYFPHYLMLWLNNLGVPWFWYFIFHLSFGGFGMYTLLKFLNQSKFSSIFGAILFMLSPYMITMTAFGHGSQMMASAYIPWIILFMFRIYDRNKIIDYAIFSLLVGLQLLRAHIQISYYTWMMIGLFILLSIYCFLREDIVLIKQILIKKINFFISLILGVLISLSLYYPVLNYSIHSTRGSINGGVGIDYATQWSMSIKEFITFFFPYSLGFGGQLYFGDLPFTDFPNYIGLFVMILSIIGLLKSEIEKKYKIYFSLVIFFSILISLGSNFVQFYNIFYNYFPHFNKFRVPAYILILTNFSFIVLSSCGLNVLAKSINNSIIVNKTNYCLLLTSSVFTILYIYFSDLLINRNSNINLLSSLIYNDSMFILISSIIIVITYFIFNYFRYNIKIFYILLIFIITYDYYRINAEIIDPQIHIPHKKIIQTENYIDNYLSVDETTHYFIDDKSKFRIFDFVGDQNRWSIHNIDNINGYYPAKLNNYNQFIKKINDYGYQLWPKGILKLLNVKYIILPGALINHTLFEDLGIKKMYYFGNNNNYNGNLVDINIYKFNDFSDRLFFTNNIQYGNKEDIYRNILLDNYDPTEIIYINDAIIKNQFFDNSDRHVEITKWEADRIEFKTNTKSDQFLVISEIFYPDGWTVTSNNKNHNIYEVNNLVRGVFVPSGKNEFIMSFKPYDLRLGRFISFIGYVLILSLIFLYYWKERSNEKI